MVAQSEWSLINAARFSNENRINKTREYVGVLYFLFALEMMQVALLCGALQGYALPLRRFYRLNINLFNNKVSTGIHIAIVVVLYFLITATAGASGYIFMSCLIGMWMAFLLVLIAIRRVVHKVQHGGDREGGAGGARRTSRDVGADVSARRSSRDVTDGGRRPSQDIALGGAPQRRASNTDGVGASLSFDFDTQSLDQMSQGSGEQGGVDHLKKMIQKMTTSYGSWTACPHPMATSQLTFTLLNLFGAVAVACIFAGVFFGWQVDDYLLISNNQVVPEYQPALNGKSIQLLYAFPQAATQFQLQLYVKLFSEECGKMYSVDLLTVDAKKKKIYDSWIAPYNINMSQFVPSDYTQYNTVDSWFVRAIDMSLRPIPTAVTSIVSPADCRMLVFEQAGDMIFYLKGYALSLDTMLSNFVLDGYPRYFENAAVVVARLAPQDYHRFHAPVSGKIVSFSRITGTYWSVNADAIRSGNDAFLNTRTVVIIDAGPRIGYVAYVAIGATCVGSVRFDVANVTIGSEVRRGEPLGSMHFGGSTVILLFSRGRILFDPVMLQRSRYGVETYMNANSEIGASR